MLGTHYTLNKCYLNQCISDIMCIVSVSPIYTRGTDAELGSQVSVQVGGSLFKVVAGWVTQAPSVPSQDHCWEPPLLAQRPAAFLSPLPICISV